jgi:hypothetical protein
MDIQKFILLRPVLYHLTDKNNLESILEERTLKSTKSIAEEFAVDNVKDFLTSKRPKHVQLSKGQKSIIIRDQYPICFYEKALKRGLESDCTVADFILMLNSRVFFWPTLKDLYSHFGRYENEKPIILKVNTEELLSLNKAPKFCRINSGAPRPHCRHNGNAVSRGHNTFLLAENFAYRPSEVREVTFEDACKLPDTLHVSNHPEGKFRSV